MELFLKIFLFTCSSYTNKPTIRKITKSFKNFGGTKAEGHNVGTDLCLFVTSGPGAKAPGYTAAF
jgi:hypothetical protein